MGRCLHRCGDGTVQAGPHSVAILDPHRDGDVMSRWPRYEVRPKAYTGSKVVHGWSWTGWMRRWVESVPH